MQNDYLLLESVEDFNWENFWDSYYFFEQNFSPLFEKFELSESSERSDIYKITANNGMEFELYINFLKPSDMDDRILNALVFDKENKKQLEKIQSILSQTENPIMNINFRDSEQSVSLTAKVGNYSHSVISGIKKAVLQSIQNRGNNLPDIVFFFIKKDEPKKLEFFKNVFSVIFPNLRETYIDIFHKDYNLVYAF
jgi:hypothetical protein